MRSSTRHYIELSESSVKVDGMELTDKCSRVSLDLVANQMPVLYLEVTRPDFDPISIEGAVQVKEIVSADIALATLEFLDALDPKTFEQDCLSALEMQGCETFGQAALTVLKGYARGD